LLGLAALSAVGVLGFFLIRVFAKGAIDLAVVRYLNQFAGRFGLVDRAASELVDLHLFKGVAAFACVCGALAAARSPRATLALATGCFAAAAAALASRITQSFLPESRRPLADPDVAFTMPLGLESDGLPLVAGWSSYPSDTSALLFGVALSVLLVDRRWGLAALGVALTSGIARVYCGLHYPTDIVGGALLAAVFVLVAVAMSSRVVLSDRLLATCVRYRGVLAAAGFVFAIQLATLFEEPRELAVGIAKLIGD